MTLYHTSHAESLPLVGMVIFFFSVSKTHTMRFIPAIVVFGLPQFVIKKLTNRAFRLTHESRFFFLSFIFILVRARMCISCMRVVVVWIDTNDQVILEWKIMQRTSLYC